MRNSESVIPQPDGVKVRDIAIGAEGLGFGTRVGQIGHSVTNHSPPLQCFFGVMLSTRTVSEMDPATRNALRRNKYNYIHKYNEDLKK